MLESGDEQKLNLQQRTLSDSSVLNVLKIGIEEYKSLVSSKEEESEDQTADSFIRNKIRLLAEIRKTVEEVQALTGAEIESAEALLKSIESDPLYKEASRLNTLEKALQ